MASKVWPLPPQFKFASVTLTDACAYRFRSQYPEIFNKVEAATRARPAGHLTFLSEYAESMKLGSKNWKQYLVTTSESANRTVFTPTLANQVCASQLTHAVGFPVPYIAMRHLDAKYMLQVAKDKGFFSWMKRQRESAPASWPALMFCDYSAWSANACSMCIATELLWRWFTGICLHWLCDCILLACRFPQLSPELQVFTMANFSLNKQLQSWIMLLRRQPLQRKWTYC